MSHRQELILKRDLLDKNAECIEEQGTSPPPKPTTKKTPKPNPHNSFITKLTQKQLFFFSSQNSSFYSLCQINLDYKGETSATVNSVSAQGKLPLAQPTVGFLQVRGQLVAYMCRELSVFKASCFTPKILSCNFKKQIIA